MSGLDDVVRRALRRTADEVVPEDVIPPSVLQRTRRRQALVGLATALSLAVVGVGGIIGVEALRSSTPPPRQVSTPPAPTSTCRPGWVVAPKPTEPGVEADSLVAVSGASPDGLWAVGVRFLAGVTAYRTVGLIEHWDGASWRVVPGAEEHGGGAEIADVVALGPDDAWVVGRWNAADQAHDAALVQRWDGRRWTEVRAARFGRPSGGPALVDIEAVGPTDVWALGRHYVSVGGESISHVVLQHWDGRSWGLIESLPPVDPSYGTSAIQDISVARPDLVWGVGGKVRGVGKAGRPDGALVQVWDGEGWRRVEPPPGARPLTAVAATSEGDVWAVRGGSLTTVGTYQVGDADEILHWDGAVWTVSHRVAGSIAAIVVRAPDDVWAAGERDDGRPLVEHWDGDAWSSVDLDTPGSVSGGFVDATVTVDGAVVAFGSDYPMELGGGGPNATEDQNNYFWVACP